MLNKVGHRAGVGLCGRACTEHVQGPEWISFPSTARVRRGGGAWGWRDGSVDKNVCCTGMRT